jgi:hypothetical protein
MTQALCTRLAAANLDCCALAIEAFAAGGNPDIDPALAELQAAAELIVEAQEVLLRIKSGVLTRDAAQALCTPDPQVRELVDDLREIAGCPPTERNDVTRGVS